jgi:uncharacterized lipoprotein YddW (UPF0748 family)
MNVCFSILGWRRCLKWIAPILFLISLIAALSLGHDPSLAQLDKLDAPIAPREEIRGVWITTNDTNMLRDRRRVQTAMSQLRQLNFNTVYPVVYNSGYVMYPSPVAQRYNIQPFVYTGTEGQDMIADVISQAHQQGLFVIPWFEFGFMAPPTSELALNNPDWLTQKRDGGQTSISAAGEVVWLNPFRPEVQQFIQDLVMEVVTRYDVDGIQFDDHMSLPAEFGYDPYTIALYRKETKKAPPNDPKDPAWIRWRADKITAFMLQLNKAIKAQKPYTVISISPNYYDFAYKLHLQDWLSWVRQNIVDEVVMQVYRDNLNSFLTKITRSEMVESQRRMPTAVGILTGFRNRPISIGQIQSQVQASRDRGLGVAFFSFESLWDIAPEPVNQRQLAFQSFFPNLANRVRTIDISLPIPPSPSPRSSPTTTVTNGSPSSTPPPTPIPKPRIFRR